MIRILKTKTLMFILVLLPFVFNPTKANSISLTIEFYSNDSAILKEYYFTTENFANFLPYQGVGDYFVKILDKNNSVLFYEKFNVLFYIQIQKETEVTYKEVNSSIVSLRLYLPSESYSIKFYKEEKEILSLFLPDLICNKNNICEREKGEDEYLCPKECLALAQVPICGNKVCESPQENQTNCCLDCGCPSEYNCIDNKCVEKPICGNNICEINLGENSNNCPQDCLTTKLPPKPKTPTYVYIIIILVIFVIIALFLYKIRIVKVKQANF